MIVFCLDWPPQVNHYYTVVRGRKVLSSKGRQYKIDTAVKMLQAKVPRSLDGRLEVRIDAFPPDKRKRDLDNLLKPLLDGIQDYGMFDDSQIDYLRIRRCENKKKGLMIVRVFEIDASS